MGQLCNFRALFVVVGLWSALSLSLRWWWCGEEDGGVCGGFWVLDCWVAEGGSTVTKEEKFGFWFALRLALSIHKGVRWWKRKKIGWFCLAFGTQLPLQEAWASAGKWQEHRGDGRGLAMRLCRLLQFGKVAVVRGHRQTMVWGQRWSVRRWQ